MSATYLWNAILETNLTGTLRACRVFGRHMIEQKYGRIINIASLSSFVALFEVAAYSVSKAAVASSTKSLAIGGHLSNHGLNHCHANSCSEGTAAAIFDKARNGHPASADERAGWNSGVTIAFGNLAIGSGQRVNFAVRITPQAS